MLSFIDWREIISTEYPIYAHTREDGKKESLGEHIELCEKYLLKINEEKKLETVIERFTETMGADKPEMGDLLKNMFCQMIVFHDFGKIKPQFQQQYMKNDQYPGKPFNGVSGTEHSFLSAVIYLDYFIDKISKLSIGREAKRWLEYIAVLHAYVISKHHGGLGSLAAFLGKLADNENRNLIENLKKADSPEIINLKTVMGFSGMRSLTEERMKNLKLKYENFMAERQNQMRPLERRRQNIFRYFYVRFLYSVLVICDYCATTEFVNGVEIKDFGSLSSISDFEKAYESSNLMKSIRKYEQEHYGPDVGRGEDQNIGADQSNEAERSTGKECRRKAAQSIEKNQIDNLNQSACTQQGGRADRSDGRDEICDIGQITDMNELRSRLFLDVERQLSGGFEKCASSKKFDCTGETKETGELDCECKANIETEGTCSDFEEATDNVDSHDDIYFLEAPTGSGKSNVAMNVSFKLMREGKKIFYIYPFNTLVEQNRQNLMDLFEGKECGAKIAVVNSLTPIKLPQNSTVKTGNDDEDAGSYYQQALLDRQFLNYPMVLSTHVSFFNMLFDNSRESIFGFFQLKDSVIVLDEIQSYRNSIWAEIIIFLKACAELMGMKIIIMSATLPRLEILAGKSRQTKYLLPNSRSYFNHQIFKNRVKISYELFKRELPIEELAAHVIKSSGAGKKVLVEFIRKDTAYRFYEMLCNSKEVDVPVRCITGDDSLYEREKILKPIRDNTMHEVILVATQVVEAGVDIDMDIGYKDSSLLDSEEQFLGRINRSCKRSGIAYFFNMDAADRIYYDDYRIDESFTLDNPEMQDILVEKRFGDYYCQVMKLLIQNRLEDTSEKGLGQFFCEKVRGLDFTAVSDRMKLIKDDNWGMDVVLCRNLEMEDGSVLSGIDIWSEYKLLLQNYTMDYAEKQVKLSVIRSKLNCFIYTIKKNVNLAYNDVIGELYCIEDGEQYFENGKLNKKSLEGDGIQFF